MITPDDIYQPIASELPQVYQTMLEVAQVEHEWLASLANHVIAKPGKRVRPAVTLLCGKLFEYNLDLLVPMAASVELLHTATLVHDDTVDEAAVRRGVATVNHAWDGTTAVLFGDYVFAASAEMVARTANVHVMRLFAQTLRVICDGELAQYFGAFRTDITREQYLHRIDCKTGALFALATESGAVLGGAPEPLVDALRAYGHNLGIAFQIVDDVLDISGDTETLGKPAGSDLANGTLTLPAIMALERTPDDHPIRRHFEHGRRREDLDAAVALLRGSRELDDAYAVAQQYGRRALRALSGLEESPARRSLEQLVAYALQRNA